MVERLPVDVRKSIFSDGKENVPKQRSSQTGNTRESETIDTRTLSSFQTQSRVVDTTSNQVKRNKVPLTSLIHQPTAGCKITMVLSSKYDQNVS